MSDPLIGIIPNNPSRRRREPLPAGNNSLEQIQKLIDGLRGPGSPDSTTVEPSCDVSEVEVDYYEIFAEMRREDE